MPQRYNTGNSRPSNSMKDLNDNALAFDDFMNSESDTFIDRFGDPKDSLPGTTKKIMLAADDAIEATRQNLIPLSRQYMTLAEAQADIANIPAGSTTYYRSPDDSALAIEVINNAGTLVATGREMLSAVGVQGEINKRLVPGDYSPSMVPLFHDRKGNVPVYLDNGKLDAAGLGPVLQQIVAEIPNDLVGQMITQYTTYSPYFFPFAHDLNGNVYIWFDNGRLDAAGLGPVLQEFIKSTISNNESSNKYFIDGDTYKLRLKQSRVFNGQSASVNIAFTGDSWTEKNTIPQSLINILGGTYKDPGWISCSDTTDTFMSNITLSVSGFTKYDGDNEHNPIGPEYGCGPDGNAYYNIDATGSLTWSGIKATHLSLFYYDGNGVFTISVDGGTPVTISCTGSNSAKNYDLTSLSTSTHTVVVSSTGSGVVSILGMYGKNSTIFAGNTISRLGNGGAIGSDYLKWDNWIAQIAPALDIDLLFIILGTNDFRKSAGVEQYTSGIQKIIDTYSAATPGICFCLVSPGQCKDSGVPALSEYDKAMRELAINNQASFISGYELFPKVYNWSSGAWIDSLHLSALGAYVLTQEINKKFWG